YAGQVERCLTQRGSGAAMLRSTLALPAFHWEIEFPEVFMSPNGGFDAFVGNPPFMSGPRMSQNLGIRYFDYLTTRFYPAGNRCDLVAYFFRRCFDLLNADAAFGLIATKTISQGDTRSGGLGHICSQGGTIFAATRRLV